MSVGSKNFPDRLVTGGQVSRVHPGSAGLNPVWRKSLAYTILATGWRDGADSTEIAAAREILVHDMKIVEGLAPESGAYLNEVNVPHAALHYCRSNFFF